MMLGISRIRKTSLLNSQENYWVRGVVPSVATVNAPNQGWFIYSSTS